MYWIIPSLLVLNCTLAMCANRPIPDEISAAVRRDFPKYRITTVDDLEQEDRTLWVNAKPGLCPGIAFGKFSPTSPAAVLLIRKTVHDVEQILVAIEVEKRTSGKDSYRLVKLDQQKSNRVRVISTVSAGRLTSADRTIVVVTTYDGIMYEVLEAVATVYYWKDGRYESLTISD